MSETRKLFESFQHNLNEAIKSTIEYATPIYTGGGIYVYVGKLNDENYFIAEDSIFNKNMPSFSIRIVNKNPEEDEDDFWNTEWQEEHLVKDMTDGETETKELTKQILDWVIKNQPDGNYDLGDIEDKRKILNNINENETVENKKLTKDTRDEVEIGDILADGSNRYVIVNIINNPRSKAITVRDEKDWRPIYADPISNWYGTTIIKGPFIRKNGKVIKESEELNSNLIKTYNETDYGYHNNATMIYGELNDGNWYVYIPDNEYLEVFNEPITQKYIDTAYNYDEDNDKSDDEWFDNFHKEHEIKYDKEDLLLRELNKRYFNLEDEED